jgi:hypothetical protein
MPPTATSFQTPLTDTTLPNLLIGKVTALDVSDPTEAGEKTSLIELGDPFDVSVSWTLDGVLTPIVGGFWIVELYSDDIDGQGQMTGRIGGPVTIPIVGAAPPLTFSTTFTVQGATTKVGVYQLVVTINHSTDSSPANVTEMVGFAESTPLKITAQNPALDTD